jgi:type I restriction enzyme S subunit
VTKGLNPNAPMKDSGVEWLGEVPEHWIVCQLKYKTVMMQTGPFGSQLHAGDYVEDGIPLINPAHMINGKLVPDSKCTVDEKAQVRLGRHKLTVGDLVLARRGELGRCAVVKETQKGWLCGTGSLRATLSPQLIPDYGFMLISSEGIKVELSLESKGSTMDNLNTEILGKIRIPFPPVQEQSSILDYVEKISQKYDRMEKLAQDQIELLQERRTALISAAVTGKIDVRNWQPPTDKDIQ